MMENSLHHRVSQLSPEQRKFLAEQLNSGKDPNRSIPVKQLIVYVTGEKSVDKSELRHYLERHLPEYMIPGAIVQLEQLPKLPNGKIDLEALLTHSGSLAPARAENLEAPNKIERLLIEIWEEVLGFESIGINDNFFEIGGDSILSIQITAKARKAGIVLAPNQLFEHQTIAQLAKDIQDSRLNSE